MLEALVAGSRDPEILAELARGQLRRKLPALQAALPTWSSCEGSLVSLRLAQSAWADGIKSSRAFLR
jgi:hypothetical protein